MMGGGTAGGNEGSITMMPVTLRIMLAALMLAQTTLWPVRMSCASARPLRAETACPCCAIPDEAAADSTATPADCPPLRSGCGCEMGIGDETPAPTPMPERGSSERIRIEQWLASTAGLVVFTAAESDWEARRGLRGAAGLRTDFAGAGGWGWGLAGEGRSAQSILCVWRN